MFILNSCKCNVNKCYTLRALSYCIILTSYHISLFSYIVPPKSRELGQFWKMTDSLFLVNYPFNHGCMPTAWLFEICSHWFCVRMFSCLRCCSWTHVLCAWDVTDTHISVWLNVGLSVSKRSWSSLTSWLSDVALPVSPGGWCPSSPHGSHAPLSAAGVL